MRWFAQHRAVRALATIAGSTAVAQLVTVGVTPLLSRIYEPAAFGTFAIVAGLALPLAAGAALRLELAIPLPPGESDAADVVRTAIKVTLGNCLVMFALLAALLGPLNSMFQPSGDRWALLAAPVYSACVATFSTLNQYAIRQKSYALIARRGLLQSAAVAMAQLAGGWIWGNTYALLISSILGQLIGIAILWKDVRLDMAPAMGGRSMIDVLHEWRRHILVLTPAALANAAGRQAPILVFGGLYGSHEAGMLGMTQRVISLPLTLIGAAVSQVFLAEFADSWRSGQRNLRNKFLKTSAALLVCGAIVGCALFALSPVLFALILGPQWEQSGHYARALALGLTIQMVAAPLSQVNVVTGRVMRQALWDIGRLIACAAAIAVPFYSSSTPLIAIWVLGVVSAISYVFLWLLSLNSLRR